MKKKLLGTIFFIEIEKREFFMEVIEKIKNLQELLLLQLSDYGFEKKRKNVFVRKKNDCIQYITILETKIKNQNKIHINVKIGFSYEIINRIISFIQEKKYEKKWMTANINLGTLINNKEPYGFYISEESEIDCIVENIMYNLVEYAIGFWNDYDDLKKFYTALKEKRSIIEMSTIALKRPEWNLLALSILLEPKSFETILEEYDDVLVKNNFSIEKIKGKNLKYDIVEESKLL